MTPQNLYNWLLLQLPELQDKMAVGCIDGNQREYIGVYDGRPAGGQRICVGGAACTRYRTKRLRLLVHWTDSPVMAAAKARQLYDLLYGRSQMDMDGVRVVAVDPGADIIPVGRDAAGISEYVIEITVTYERG